MLTRRIQAVAATALLLAVFVAHAADDPDNVIKYRKNVMKTNGANLADAAAIIQGKVSFKDRLLDHAKALETFTRNIPELFPKGSDFGDTEAKDAVWKNWPDFQKKAKDAHEKAVAFTKAVETKSKDLPMKLRALADGCKACHKDYRHEEQQ